MLKLTRAGEVPDTVRASARNFSVPEAIAYLYIAPRNFVLIRSIC
jgi:hypothetical protein